MTNCDWYIVVVWDIIMNDYRNLFLFILGIGTNKISFFVSVFDNAD
jgi:hypothetical protein